MKKILILILLGIIGIGCFFLFSGNEGFNIKIKNQTNKKLSGLILTTPKGDIKIPTLLEGEVYKINVMPNGKRSITLQYKDENGKTESIGVIGQLNKEYHGKAEVIFDSIDESGSIDVNSSYEISNYKLFN
ncbi:hypothetical protein [Bacillus sp. EAC]|uniref:hypothetical protein n=1 Tax=Bacillus sp. EAC TaxID=1978338 RepID=UPI000B4314F9|nr:hypothetical protein [Bacillus sp. EAC]